MRNCSSLMSLSTDSREIIFLFVIPHRYIYLLEVRLHKLLSRSEDLILGALQLSLSESFRLMIDSNLIIALHALQIIFDGTGSERLAAAIL